MPKQERLKGIAKEISGIESAAKDYVAVRDRRMDLTKKEVEAREILITEMKKARLETYTTVDGLLCTLTTSEKVKVSGAKGEEAE